MTSTGALAAGFYDDPGPLQTLTDVQIHAAALTVADHAIRHGWTTDLPTVLAMLGVDE